MLKEGQIRIPSGCAIAAIIDRKGGKINGSEIIKSIALMHDRSNGLGGGFAAYGIYPEHAQPAGSSCNLSRYWDTFSIMLMSFPVSSAPRYSARPENIPAVRRRSSAAKFSVLSVTEK